ncbi:DNA polymerase zeta catalytic subunit [Candida viswanathii]|uniref:DNA polymerase n=1 Tax=Candida viswanathii TaxID=5486 RepID=A0A367YFQ7_9ASCO|nr:DNA polymerase zeta catalytic subunit [Candida viswanathii]
MNTTNDSTANTTFNASSVNWTNNQVNSNSNLRVQINDYDTYQTFATRLDQYCTRVTQVPIIRIYGSIAIDHEAVLREVSPRKKKQKIEAHASVFNVVIHVHNFYPYIYVNCHETDYAKLQDEKFIELVVYYLEAALKVSFQNRRGRKKGGDGEDDEEEDDDRDAPPVSSKVRKYIASVAVCKGVPIYGFQVGYQLFYKISLLSPLYKSRLTKLFQDKKISLHRFGVEEKENVIYQPEPHYVYEGHIPYLLQFLTDFNLFGCGWLNIDKDFIADGDAKTRGLYFRSPILTDLHKSGYDPKQIDVLSRYLSKFITADNVLRSGESKTGHALPFNRIGKSILEMDITSASIVNRSWLVPRDLHDDFTERDEYNLYKEAADSGQLKHGYKYDNEGHPRIYLSSLKQIYNDLKFQCRSRNSTFDVSTDALQTSKVSYFGTGTSTWSNEQLNKDLLDYVVKLNGQLKLDLRQYSSKVLKSRRLLGDKDPFEQFPTSFQLVDIEKNKEYHSFGMRFDQELIKWDNYDGLFTSQPPIQTIEESHVTELILPDVLSSDTEFSDLDVNDLLNMDKDQKSEPKDEVSDDPEEQEEEEEEEHDDTIDDQAELTQLHHFDESIIKEMSQLKPTAVSNHLGVDQLSFIEDFSFPPTPEQPVMKNLKVTENTYEIPVPEQLKPENCDQAFQDSGMLKINYDDPFYDNANDVPPRPLIFANQKIIVPLKDHSLAPSLDMSKLIQDEVGNTGAIKSGEFRTWQYLPEPPSKDEVKTWLKTEESNAMRKYVKHRSQIEPGKSQGYDFKCSYNSEKVSRKPDEFNYLTSFHVEIHANPPNEKLSVDPLRDPVSLIVYSFDDANHMFGHCTFKSGILIFNRSGGDKKLIERLSVLLGKHIEAFDNEMEMLAKLVTLVELFDPDILSGYEVNSMSWGYLVERSREVFDLNLMANLSRGNFKSNGKFGDRWGYTHTSNIEISGRHMLNVWRILRSEMSLTSYSLENVTYHLLHHTLPKFLHFQLSQWMKSGKFRDLSTVLSYYIQKVETILKIINVRELITRNVEHSRLIGIEFNSNFYRGSQFKIESILSRIAKPESLLLNSPSKQDVHEMRPLECIPLILEPKSNFYKSPLVVLDFQSLYPSIMIAYNYCYSTLLCKLHNYRPGKNDIGYLRNLKLVPGLVDLLIKEDGVNISPNGFVFVKSHIRKSILAKMLEEILNIRIKVKEVMKLFKDDAELTRLYNARQLALKLIANVTYGYTSATFSGRMPNSDISDAIVSTGREILNKSIELIEAGNYGAKVVYGDTDSLFVYFPGKSKSEAFKLGKAIAKDITDFFPDPVKLKFEKVYHPCVLLAKKRYVGYSYEYEGQETPKFDAKGIETVRRDGIPAQLKMTEKTLRILFETKNLSKVKKYTVDQFYKIIFNKVSVKDFCFAKEVRYGTYRSEKHLPPGALIASKMVEEDPRKEPQYRERVPYVVYKDSSKPRIKDRCITPEEFIRSYQTNKPYELDAEYYITRVLIPPLERIFNLIGVDVQGWYKQMPKSKPGARHHAAYAGVCLVCGKSVDLGGGICLACLEDEQKLLMDVNMTHHETEEKIIEIENLCRDCVHHAVRPGTMISECADSCTNGDCSVYYNKSKLENESKQMFATRGKILLEW